MEPTQRAIEAVWRVESRQLLGGLLRLVRDVGLAEDLAQEALVLALEQWPTVGIPRNPGAWLMTAAKNRGLDELRRRQMQARRHDVYGAESALSSTNTAAERLREMEQSLDEPIRDDELRLLLVACHPVLPREARAALTLRLVGGLSTDEIARGFLVPEPTVAQRIVRAKRTLSEARVPFEVPRGEELNARLPSVLEVVYLIYNEGYSATRGDEWIRHELCDDALRIGRILARLLPDEAEVHGLIALLELQTSRLRARTAANGEPILLLAQDRGRWDHLLIHRGLTALSAAETLAANDGAALGPYTLQAAIAACHARARTAAETDWVRIVALYDGLAALTGSPVVELNRAVAISMAFGPAEALDLVNELADDPSLRSYHLLPTVRGDLLERLGRLDEAQAEFVRAAELTENGRERAVLRRRAAACERGPGGQPN
jgi:RNA polymerase sigma-70 factor, ECF subfamily